jgi:hypothetical protein
MVFYFSIQNSSTVALYKLVSVTCEKCGCAYFYELTRFGSGSTEAAYGVLELYHLTARQQAEAEARHHLANDAELVPCPACQWVNEDLVTRFRMARTAGWAALTSLVVRAGAVLTLLATLIGYFSAGLSWGLILYIIVPGILGTAMIATMMMAMQKWIERGIQPNRGGPDGPSLPFGTPSALVRNELGQLVPSIPDSQLQVECKTVALQLGRQLLDGGRCCLCMDDASPMSSVTIQPIAGFEFHMGLCWGCGLRHSLFSGAKWVGAGLFVFAAMTLLANQLGIREEGIIVVNLLFSLAVSLIVWLYVRYPISVKLMDATRGVLRLKYRNPEFPALVYVEQPRYEKDADVPDFSFLN